MARPALF